MEFSSLAGTLGVSDPAGVPEILSAFSFGVAVPDLAFSPSTAAKTSDGRLLSKSSSSDKLSSGASTYFLRWECLPERLFSSESSPALGEGGGVASKSKSSPSLSPRLRFFLANWRSVLKRKIYFFLLLLFKIIIIF